MVSSKQLIFATAVEMMVHWFLFTVGLFTAVYCWPYLMSQLKLWAAVAVGWGILLMWYIMTSISDRLFNRTLKRMNCARCDRKKLNIIN